MTVRDFADKLGVKAKDLIQMLMQREASWPPSIM